MQKTIFYFLFFWSILFLGMANDVAAQAAPSSLLEEANTAFTAKDYTKASKIYEGLLQNRGKSSGLEYNLANSYFNAQELGQAILHYERAIRIAPFDNNIAHNLAIAQHTQVDNIPTIKGFFLLRWILGLRNLLSSDSWAVVGLLLMAGFAAGMLIWLFGESREIKRKGFLYGLLLLFLSFLPFWASYELSALEIHSGMAVILAKEVQMHSAPDVESETVLLIHEGLKVDLLDTIGDWVKVQLPNGEQGWIPAGAAVEI